MDRTDETLRGKVEALADAPQRDDDTRPYAAIMADLRDSAASGEALEDFLPFVLGQYARVALELMRALDFEVTSEEDLVREIERHGFDAPNPMADEIAARFLGDR
jgi:hypothetical protein